MTGLTSVLVATIDAIMAVGDLVVEFAVNDIFARSIAAAYLSVSGDVLAEGAAALSYALSEGFNIFALWGFVTGLEKLDTDVDTVLTLTEAFGAHTPHRSHSGCYGDGDYAVYADKLMACTHHVPPPGTKRANPTLETGETLYFDAQCIFRHARHLKLDYFFQRYYCVLAELTAIPLTPSQYFLDERTAELYVEDVDACVLKDPPTDSGSADLGRNSYYFHTEDASDCGWFRFTGSASPIIATR